MLAWFRRHAKILMVVLGSSAMAIFGLGPVFDTLASRGRGDDPREKEVVATWKGGDITRVDLDQMERRHFQTLRFLNGVQQAAEEKKGDVVNSLVIPISPIQDGKREMIDAQLISRFLMAERAKEEGMMVSDDMVKEYIALLSDDAGFSQRDLDAINDVANNKYCSFNSVRERLKSELLANQMQLCCMTAVPIIPNPVEAVELYRRTMEQIECQILPIEVAKYIDKVSGEPSPADIKKLYEAGKYDFPDPLGERAGFKIGRKVNLQYLIADYQTYLQNEMNKLSDEEVQKEYDRLVAAMDELVLEPLKVDDDVIEINDPPPSDSGVDPPPVDSAESGDQSETPDDVTPPPAGAEKSDDVTPPPAGAEKSATQSDGDAPVKNPEPAAEKTDAGKTENENSKEDNTDQSYKVGSTKSQFVSTAFQESEPQEGEGTEKATEGTKKPDPADGSNAEAGKPGGTPEAQDAPPADDANSAVAGDNASGTQVPGGIDAALKAAADEAESAQDEKSVDRVAKPLKDVVEEVKSAMCQQATQDAMKLALVQASVIVQDHFQQRLSWEFDNAKKELEEPAPLNIEKIAADYNLIAKETGLVDAEEIINDQCAQVREFKQYVMQGRQVPQLVPVGQSVFDDFSDLDLYEWKTLDDNWGSKSSYLYWLAEKSEISIPTLEEATPKIIEFWKNQKALELALAEADTIKQKVNSSDGKKMSELYSDRASDTGAFTWFSNFGSTRYSSPIGVTMPGEEFMKMAFSLGMMKAGVAENMSKDTIYVIQSLSESKSIEEIGSDYLVNQFFKFKRIPNEVQQVSQLYFQEFNYAWRQEFEDMMGLKFMDR